MPDTQQLKRAADKIERLQKLSAALLDDLQYRVEDRADSSLPEWEAEAKHLGIQVNVKCEGTAGKDSESKKADCQSLLVRIPDDVALRAVAALRYRYTQVMDDPDTHMDFYLAKLLKKGADADKLAIDEIEAALRDAYETRSPAAGH